jgi:hypothetical protein
VGAIVPTRFRALQAQPCRRSLRAAVMLGTEATPNQGVQLTPSGRPIIHLIGPQAPCF